MQKPTYETIGKILGVSKVSVCKALNNKSGVSEELRKKIKEVALQAGYRPVNSTYHEKMTFLYAVRKDFFLMSAEQFYTSIYYYLTEECKISSSKIEILLTEPENEYESICSFLTQNPNTINGIFIAGSVSNKSLAEMKKITLPLVFIDFYSPAYHYNYVYLDNYNLSFLATSTLIEYGHQSIGFIGDIHSTSSICDRYFGYRKALEHFNLNFEKKFFINQNLSTLNTSADYLIPEELPTAYLCHCDDSARKLYQILKLRNVKIPDDLSVLSFDNTDICKKLSPTLSSVGLSKEKYATRSLDLMLDLINNNNRKTTILLTPHLHMRDSVKKLK